MLAILRQKKRCKFAIFGIAILREVSMLFNNAVQYWRQIPLRGFNIAVNWSPLYYRDVGGTGSHSQTQA